MPQKPANGVSRRNVLVQFRTYSPTKAMLRAVGGGDVSEGVRTVLAAGFIALTEHCATEGHLTDSNAHCTRCGARR